MFTLLSSWLGHCECSFGSHDKIWTQSKADANSQTNQKVFQIFFMLKIPPQWPEDNSNLNRNNSNKMWLPVWQSLCSLLLSKGVQMIHAEMLCDNLHFRKVEKSLKTWTTCNAKHNHVCEIATGYIDNSYINCSLSVSNHLFLFKILHFFTPQKT